MTSHTVRINTISKSEAQNVIEAWNKEDSYYEMNSIARDLNRKARPYPYLASSDYAAATMNVSTNVPVDGPLNLVYLDGRSDSGLPHTRGMKGIALPIFLLWNPRPATLQHEIVHLSQKQYRAKWWRLYRDKWNFEIASAQQFMTIPEKWRRRRRINPDTLGNPYVVWKGRYIPLTVFVSNMSPDLKVCKRGFWDLEMEQWTWEPPSGWADTFGSGFNDEHPNEIAAHWIDGSAGSEKRAFFNGNVL